MINIDVQKVNTVSSSDIRRLVETQKFYPYSYLRGIDKPAFVSYLTKEIMDLMERDTIHIFSASDGNGKVCGLLIGEFLKWDTEIFGIPCARVRYVLTEEDAYSYEIKSILVQKVTAWAKQHNIEFMDASSHPLDFNTIKALTRNHFDLMATHIYHIWDFRTDLKIDHKITVPIRLATIEDLNNLVNIDFSIFPEYNRFYLDKKLTGTGNIPILFKEWIKNSLLGKRASNVWLAEIDNQIVGYVTVLEDKDTKNTLGIRVVNVDMVGVLPSVRNRGIYIDMITTVLHWAKDNKVDVVQGIIHVCNAPANSVSTLLKSRILGAHHNFHWHAE